MSEHSRLRDAQSDVALEFRQWRNDPMTQTFESAVRARIVALEDGLRRAALHDVNAVHHLAGRIAGVHEFLDMLQSTYDLAVINRIHEEFEIISELEGTNASGTQNKTGPDSGTGTEHSGEREEDGGEDHRTFWRDEVTGEVPEL